MVTAGEGRMDLGNNAASSLSSAGALFTSVTDLCEADYIRAWDGFLDDLRSCTSRRWDKRTTH
jgi:hypothetical protein